MFDLEVMRKNIRSTGVVVPDGLAKAELQEWLRRERIKRRELRVGSTK